MSYKQLYRSVHNRRIAGVAGGIAEYFAVDPTLIRLLWLLAVFLGGSGVLGYIIAWIVIPEAPISEADGSQPFINTQPAPESPSNPNWGGYGQRNGFIYLGIFLILLGGFFLLKEILPWHLSRYSWALFLIILGLIILIPRRKEPK